MKENEGQNTIVICSDEHHFRYSGYAGHPYVQTPNLDELAKDGAVFQRAYCPSPVCTPSRMGFITGKYVSQIGSWFIGCPLDKRESTWASRLSAAGVHTTMLGKMDFCGPYQSGGFDDYRIIERRGAFKPYPRIAPLGSRTKDYVREDKLRHILHSGIRKDIQTDGRGGHDDELGFFDHDRMVTQWALDFLRAKEKKREKKPWVLYLGYLMPHWPYICPKEYFDLYYPNRVNMPFDCVMPENERLHPAIRAFQRACNFKDVTQEDIRRVLASYSGMITAMDGMIGQVLSELKRQGIYENTNILYTSDHGDSCGEHGLFYKQCSYDGSAAVPLIVKGPCVQPGITVTTPVTLVDMYPTLLSLYGLSPEVDRPGKSWIPLLRGESAYGMSYAFCEYHGNFFRDSWYMLLQDGFKYTYYVGDRPTLYNIEQDPHEMNDLAGEADQVSRLVAFEKLLREILNPEEVDRKSKEDLGLIGKHGEDYTKELTYEQLQRGFIEGTFEYQPEFAAFDDYENEY